MLIRRAIPADAEGIIIAHSGSIRQVCAADYTPEQIEAWAGRNFKASQWVDTMARDFVWVVENKSEIAGYGHLALMSETEAEVMGLYFLPVARGLGLGKKMFEEFLQIARLHHIKSLSLHATLTALSFYQALGFTASEGKCSVEMRGVDIPCRPMSMKIL